MNWNPIHRAEWNRKDTFSAFFSDRPCTFSMTVSLDITQLDQMRRRAGLKLFPVLLYGISSVVNRHAEFRMDLDAQGEPGFYSHSNPSYPVFHPETKTFTTVWTEYHPDFSRFLQAYEEDLRLFRNSIRESKPIQGSNLFYVSSIPWASFSGFHLNLQKGYVNFAPIFTIGKYSWTDGRLQLPLASQVHHAVCDGYHLSRAVNELQEWADAFSL